MLAQTRKKPLTWPRRPTILTPNDPLVTHTLGHLAFLTGDYKWALSLLQLAAQAQPQNPEVLYDLGGGLLQRRPGDGCKNCHAKRPADRIRLFPNQRMPGIF